MKKVVGLLIIVALTLMVKAQEDGYRLEAVKAVKTVVGLFIIVVTKSRIPVIYVTLGNPLHVPIWLMVQGCRHLRLLPQGGRGMSTNCAF